MASKFVIHTPPIVLHLVRVQTLRVIPTGPRKEHVLMFKPSETEVIVDVSQITKAALSL